MFRAVKSKDVFEEFYQRGMCRRLLLKKSASLEAERHLIGKLKQECGDQFTTKVEGMLRDISTSAQVMQEYKASRTEASAQTIEVHFNVLSHSSWPIQHQEKTVLLPAALTNI